MLWSCMESNTIEDVLTMYECYCNSESLLICIVDLTLMNVVNYHCIDAFAVIIE